MLFRRLATSFLLSSTRLKTPTFILECYKCYIPFTTLFKSGLFNCLPVRLNSTKNNWKEISSARRAMPKDEASAKNTTIIDATMPRYTQTQFTLFYLQVHFAYNIVSIISSLRSYVFAYSSIAPLVDFQVTPVLPALSLAGSSSVGNRFILEFPTMTSIVLNKRVHTLS